VKNYHISVKEVDNKVIFLRKLCEGGVAHSFGIHVARMAGMPQQVVDSAQRTLNMLEQKGDSQWEAREGAGVVEDEGAKKGRQTVGKKKKESAADNLQLSFFQLEDPLLCDLRDSIKAMDINTMSPLDAFDAIRRLKEKLGLKH
jgi:DNA mismatch repair protein MutS